MKIIVAEDGRATRMLISRTLQGWGYDVTGVADGEAAWDALSRSGVSLLISDWEMPCLDGPSLCRRIRSSARGEYVYILLLTSHNDPTRIVEGLEAGANDFVTKPFNPAELRARLGVGRRILTLQDELAAKHRELERANSQLMHVAATDPLMQIGNRRKFEEVISRIHDSGCRYGIMMADVDHFKSFNDTYGHATGDRVLSKVAEVLRETLATEGELFRFGGEEIVLITTDKGAEQVQHLAERLRSAIDAIRLEREEGEPLRVTASFGAALSPSGSAKENASWHALLERADEALYVAKKGGRNRVSMALEPLSWNELVSAVLR